MKKSLLKIKELAKSFLWDFPPTGNYLLNRYMREHFSNEMELLKGKHKTDNSHPSIIHFSMNKAATQYVRGLLNRCAIENGMTPIGLAEYAFHTNFPYLDNLSVDDIVKYQYLFKPNGYLYSVFGGMVDGILDFEKYLVVLMIRDPRDVLVSEYYSYAFSHSVPSKRGSKYNDFMKQRQMARRVSIDEYCEKESYRVYETCQRYINLLLVYPNIHITKYEDMSVEFQTWLNNLLTYCDLEISNNLLQTIWKEAEKIKPKQENVYQHVRKGAPGDYKEKLKEKTIDYLTSTFSVVLEKFNYL